MGPQPRFLGYQILYEPPYAWLMRLPVFDSAVRAPARFAMPAALALSVAAGLAFSRLTSEGLEELRARMPFADFAQFEKNPDIKDISDLFTVQLITKYIQNKLEASHPNKECKQRFAATA